MFVFMRIQTESRLRSTDRSRFLSFGFLITARAHNDVQSCQWCCLRRWKQSRCPARIRGPRRKRLRFPASRQTRPAYEVSTVLVVVRHTTRGFLQFFPAQFPAFQVFHLDVPFCAVAHRFRLTQLNSCDPEFSFSVFTDFKSIFIFSIGLFGLQAEDVCRVLCKTVSAEKNG